MQEKILSVEFFEIGAVEDHLLKFAVIAARYRGKWIFCKHKERSTWEIPGGRREEEEDILQTARRELYEETGAKDFILHPVCIYAVCRTEKSYGLLCLAEVETLGPLPELEIECIQLTDTLPDALTYPHIQPFLFERVKEALNSGG